MVFTPPKNGSLIFLEMATLQVCALSLHLGPCRVWSLIARHKHIPFHSLVVKQKPQTNDKSKAPQGGGAVRRAACVVWGELPALKEGETAQKEGSLHIPEASELGGQI